MNMLEKILEEIENLNYYPEGMGCGIEDCGITDIYEACEYGWNQAIEAAIEVINNMDDGKDINVGSNWIPIKWRDTTDEDGIDKEKYPIFMDCPMPNDGDEILITLKNGEVLEDTCFDDDGYYLDSGFDWVDDVKAWMPKPEGYKGE